jgi:cellulose synthase/poly-beta-1,6-N-acetylglucosamine synthase-like glycosyltransferase
MSLALGSPLWNLCYLLVLLGLTGYGLHRCSIIWLFLRHRRDLTEPTGHFADTPRITVQLPLYNEAAVAGRLIRAVGELDYPPEKLDIQVLDDSTDETTEVVAAEVARLRTQGLGISHIRRGNREGFKAGALAHGMDLGTGEFIFILDADFIPPSDILRRTVDHFTDPGLGLVQMRWGHLNRSQSLLTRLQAMFLDGHLLLEQTARCHSGRYFNFNGTAGIWRRRAIEEAGGWHADTLTEDLDLSYRSQLKGWRFLFLPDLVIPAELPAEMGGFKTQQKRWTKGSIQTCLKILPQVWASPVPLINKLEATAHLTSNFGYLLLVLLCILTLPHSMGPKQSALYGLLVDLPIFLATTVSIALFYVVAQRHLNPTGWKRDLILLPMLLALATGMSVNNSLGVLEALSRRGGEFTRTPKTGSGASSPAPSARRVRFRPTKLLLPVLEILFALYFGYCVWNAGILRQWMSIPFLLMFLAGFLYVAWTSLNLPGIPFPSREGPGEDLAGEGELAA